MKKAFFCVLVLVAVWTLWPGARDSGTKPAHGGHAIFDRVWIDHLPKAPKEKVDVFLVLREIANLGVFERTSAYEGAFHVFEWTSKKEGALELTLLQSEKKAKIRYRVSHGGCEPFDLCLEVRGAPMGSKKYGSMKEWVIEGGAANGFCASDEGVSHLCARASLSAVGAQTSARD